MCKIILCSTRFSDSTVGKKTAPLQNASALGNVSSNKIFQKKFACMLFYFCRIFRSSCTGDSSCKEKRSRTVCPSWQARIGRDNGTRQLRCCARERAAGWSGIEKKDPNDTCLNWWSRGIALTFPVSDINYSQTNFRAIILAMFVF